MAKTVSSFSMRPLIARHLVSQAWFSTAPPCLASEKVRVQRALAFSNSTRCQGKGKRSRGGWKGLWRVGAGRGEEGRKKISEMHLTVPSRSRDKSLAIGGRNIARYNILSSLGP